MAMPKLLIAWDEPTLWYSVMTILVCPLYWNVAGRLEYRNHHLSRLCGSRFRGCVVLALTIILLTLFRDVKFNEALSGQPRWYVLQDNRVLWSAYTMLLMGTFLVITSFWALGFTGTFLGDYFGILLPKRVTHFPFNLFNNPMYFGATLNFFAISLVKCSQAGLFLSCIVAIAYYVAVYFEGPFTEEIYLKAADKSKKNS